MRTWLLILLLVGLVRADLGPGKTYLEYLGAARKATSARQLVRYFPEERQKELSSLSPGEDQMMLAIFNAVAPQSPRVVSERIMKDKAQILLTARVNGKTADGKTEMILQKGTWRIVSESWAARK